jgi:mRNA-degrading endonuclease toxin of MazEF toxin-antitoxin module
MKSKANPQKPSFIQADNIHTVPKHRLVKYLGTIEPATMKEVSRKVVLALELESSMQ